MSRGIPFVLEQAGSEELAHSCHFVHSEAHEPNCFCNDDRQEYLRQAKLSSQNTSNRSSISQAGLAMEVVVSGSEERLSTSSERSQFSTASSRASSGEERDDSSSSLADESSSIKISDFLRLIVEGDGSDRKLSREEVQEVVQNLASRLVFFETEDPIFTLSLRFPLEL